MNPEIQIVVREAVTLPKESEALPQHAEVPPEEEHLSDKPRILAELVIEEVSIDGMCGVY